MSVTIKHNSDLITAGNWSAEFWVLKEANSDVFRRSPKEENLAVLARYFKDTAPKHAVSNALKEKIQKWLNGEKVSINPYERVQMHVVLAHVLNACKAELNNEIIKTTKTLESLLKLSE